MKRVVRNCLIASLVALTGCSETTDTTTIATATGGAVGAGLGAIIGSATGDAGAGLAIGAAAGAGTGALVGSALESQEVAIQAQDEALARQQQEIEAQRREINELRGVAGDSTASNGQIPKIGTLPQAPRDPRLAMNGKSYPGPTGQAPYAARAGSATVGDVGVPVISRDLAMRVPDAPPSRVVGTSRGTNTTSSATTFRGYNDTTVVEPKIVKSNDPTVPQASGTEQVETTTETVVTDQDVVAEAFGADEGVAVVENIDTETVTTATNVAATTSAAKLTPECAQAQGEATKAAEATERPDQLFHLRRALRLCPEDPDLHVRLGETYIALNRNADAEYEFREALNIAPQHAQAAKSLEQLSR